MYGSHTVTWTCMCDTNTHTHTLAKLLEYLHGASPSCATNWTIIESSESWFLEDEPHHGICFVIETYISTAVFLLTRQIHLFYIETRTHWMHRKKKTCSVCPGRRLEFTSLSTFNWIFGNDKGQILKSRFWFWIQGLLPLQTQIFFAVCSLLCHLQDYYTSLHICEQIKKHEGLIMVARF